MDKLTTQTILPLLRTRAFGRPLHYLPITTSTNDVAAELAMQGATEGTVVLSDTQTAGRGRLSRRWLATPGACLLVSILLRPALPPNQVFGLTILGGLATARAVERHAGIHCDLKWPNDVLVRGRKLAGVLCEGVATGTNIDYAIMGIGINVNMRPEAYPEIAALATSLSREIGQDIERAPLLATLLEEAEGLYHILLDGGLGPIRQEWRSRLAMLGQRVRVEEGWVSGLALDVDEDGALLLRTDDGEVRRIMVGDAIVESGND